jgi:nicotinamidase-related amidase
MGVLRVPANLYQQFDADYSLDVPGEGYGGWRKEALPFSVEHTALTVMHAWDVGSREDHAAAFRACEYLERSYRIARDVFPPLLAAARGAGLQVIHIVGGPGDYYSHHAGFVAGDPSDAAERAALAPPDPVYDELRSMRALRIFPGGGNIAEHAAATAGIDFLPSAVPHGNESVVATSSALTDVCRRAGVNHLVYCGFALDDCLLTSPGGMVDMSRRGFVCSAVRQAVTAIENRETARRETAKDVALWRVALHFGLVYDDADLMAALQAAV